MRVMNGDVVFLRDGSPAVVKKVNPESGDVVLDYEVTKVQKHAQNGIKNSLDERQRSSYNLNLSQIKDETKQEEIQNLYDLIQDLKETKRIDPKVLHYLENELMHRMNRDKYVPPEYEVNFRNVPQY